MGRALGDGVDADIVGRAFLHRRAQHLQQIRAQCGAGGILIEFDRRGERADDDGAALSVGAHQRHHRLQRAHDRFEIGGAGLTPLHQVGLRWRRGRNSVDDSPIEPSILAGDERGGGGPALGIGDVERQRGQPLGRGVLGFELICQRAQRGFVCIDQDEAAVGAARNIGGAGGAKAGGRRRRSARPD